MSIRQIEARFAQLGVSGGSDEENINPKIASAVPPAKVYLLPPQSPIAKILLRVTYLAHKAADRI